jgi:hypothetical protein
MIEVTLTQGQVALIDDADWEIIAPFKWTARWSKYTRSYYAITNSKRVNGKRHIVLMHRLILGLEKGDPRIGDHREPAATLDNRRDNLRIATRSGNAQNSRIPKNNTTGVKGVSYRPERKHPYVAGITHRWKRIHLGGFDTPEEAAAAVRDAAARIHGEYARTA